MYESLCPQCLQRFRHNNLFQSYCSDACRQGAYRDRKARNVGAVRGVTPLRDGTADAVQLFFGVDEEGSG